MRILLTGTSGQVGSALKSHLRAYDVVAADRSVLNLEDGDEIAPFIEQVRPQIVINCAAYTAVDKAEIEPALATQINATAPGLIAAASRSVGAALIHFSTDYVFDGEKRKPYLEGDACSPINVYGHTKQLGEQAIAAAGGNFLIVRTSWLYSASGNNFLRTMLRLGNEKTEIDVVNDQTGAPTSVLALARSLAAIIAQMKEGPSEYLGKHSNLLNIACAGQTSWHGFASAIFDEVQRRGGRLSVKSVRPVTTAQFPRPARRPVYSVLDLTRMQQEFKIEPTAWRDALREVVDNLSL